MSKKRGDEPIQEFQKRYEGEAGIFESLDVGEGSGPCKSIEGFLIMITGVHEEAQEDDINDAFSKYGNIKNLHLNLDRRTGYVKGYALVEFDDLKSAQEAIEKMSGAQLLGKTINVDFAFKKPPKSQSRGGAGKKNY